MAFHEVRFPDNISRGARGGPERRTQIVELASGDEERNASWANSRRRYDVAYGIRRADDLAAVVAFFEARNGRLHGFRFKDWGDHKSCLPSSTPSPTDQAIGTGDGTTTTFQLVKRYASGAQSWSRAIAKPVAGTSRIALGGVEQPSGWSVDTATGVVTFGTAPSAGVAITAGFEFDVPVRFDTDALDVIANYGKAMQDGMHKVLTKRGIPHSFTGHHSMSGLFFSAEAPTTYRNWKLSDYTFYDTMAGYLIDMGVMCEPDSREPWFISSAHDAKCLEETLGKFEEAVDLTLDELARGRHDENKLMPGISG